MNHIYATWEEMREARERYETRLDAEDRADRAMEKWERESELVEFETAEQRRRVA